MKVFGEPVRCLYLFFGVTSRFFPRPIRRALNPAYLKIMRSIYWIASFPRSIGPSLFENLSKRKVLLAEIRRVTELASWSRSETWSITSKEEDGGLAASKTCHEEMGVYPISFSIPKIWQEHPGSQAKMEYPVSPVFPGQAYSYSVLEDYMDQYSKSALAVTHKKGGWDCFRHLEILSAGSLPLMPDIEYCPPYTMVHYPKKVMAEIVERLQSGLVPDNTVYEFVHNWAKRNLTSIAMARYIFEALDVSPKRILFLDEGLPKRADYLSVFTLIGLMQEPSWHVDVAFPVEYIFQDWQGDASGLYGRGFGFAKVLETTKPGNYWCSRGTCATPPDWKNRGPNLSHFDVVLVGDLSANRLLTQSVDATFTSSTKAYLRGDDLAPTRSEYKWIKSLEGRVFSREIY